MVGQIEQIILEAEEGPVLQSVGRANAALEQFEKRGARAGQNVSRSFETSGEVVVRAMDRSRASAERLVASIERKAVMAGKSGVERLVAERDLLIRRLSGEERAIARVKAAYDKLIHAQQQAEGSSRQFGTSIENFLRNPIQSLSGLVEGLAARLGAGGLIGAGLAAGFAVAGKAAIDFVARIGAGADLMANLAARTGLTVNQVDKLQAMARIADVNLETMEQGVRQLAAGLSGIGRGGDMAREAIRRLGVQVYDASGRQREMGQVLLDVLQALGRVENQAERVALANSILSIGAKELLPLIRNYGALEREVTRLGFGMDEHLLKRLGAASDEVDKLGLRWGLLKRRLAEPAAAVVDVIVRITETLFQARGPEIPTRPEERIHFSAEPERRRRELMTAVAMAADRELERRRWRELAESFRRELARTPEGMRARLQDVEREKEPLVAALLSGDLAPEAFRQKRGELNRLEREKAAIEARIKALDDARRNAEEKAKIAARLRAEIEHYKRLVAIAAAGGQVREIVPLAKDVQAEADRAIEYHAQRFQAGLQAENARLEEEVRNIEKVLLTAKRVDEQKVAALAREARMREQLIRLRTGPGSERQAVEETYQLRLDYAQREFQIHKDRARFEEAVQEAEIDRVTKIAELERRRFDELRQAAEGIFDALLTRSQSLGDALLNIFKTAVLTPIKQAFSSMIAGMLMPAYGAAGRGAAGGGLRSILGLGGLLGGGAMPSFAGVPIPGAPGGTVGIAGPVSLGGGLARGGAFGLPLGAGFDGGLLSLIFNRGSIPLGGGMATTAAGIGGLGGAALGVLTSPAALIGGGLLGYAGLRRGGLSGLATAAAGGALVGTYFLPGLGTAIGAGIGAVAWLFRMFFRGAEEKLREKIRAVYGVEMRDKGILRQLLEIAKQGFGGNLDVAIRSPQIRDLIELYAMATGQSSAGLASRMAPVSLLQQGGALYQQTFPPGAVPRLDRIGAGTPQSTGPIVINITVPGAKEFFEKETVRVVLDNPRAVQSSSLSATRANAGRRELLALQLSPGTLIA